MLVRSLQKRGTLLVRSLKTGGTLAIISTHLRGKVVYRLLCKVRLATAISPSGVE
jgi:endonuclease/exonuclease/phosphatase family metal-dependent hydrolase